MERLAQLWCVLDRIAKALERNPTPVPKPGSAVTFGPTIKDIKKES